MFNILADTMMTATTLRANDRLPDRFVDPFSVHAPSTTNRERGGRWWFRR